MNAHGRECLVTRYGHHVANIVLPDPNDRHVVAVAIASNTPVIVTLNLSDFPAEALQPHGIEAVHPDDFVIRLYEEAPEALVALVRLQRASLRNPPKTAVEYEGTLRSSGLPKLAERLASHVDVI